MFIMSNFTIHYFYVIQNTVRSIVMELKFFTWNILCAFCIKSLHKFS